MCSLNCFTVKLVNDKVDELVKVARRIQLRDKELASLANAMVCAVLTETFLTAV